MISKVPPVGRVRQEIRDALRAAGVACLDTVIRRYADHEWADLIRLARSGCQGLFDEQHGLVMLGVEDGRLVGRAYRWDEGRPLEVECHLMLRSSDL